MTTDYCVVQFSFHAHGNHANGNHGRDPFVDIGTKRASSVSHTRLFHLFPVTRFLYLPYIVYIKFLSLNIR